MAWTRFNDDHIYPREVTVTTDVLPEARPMAEWLATVPSERDIRVTLKEGDQWPLQVRRNKGVQLTFNAGGSAMTLVGKVKHKRLNVAVFRGHITVRS